MKNFFLITFLLFSTPLFACENFNGTYRDQTGDKYTIVQAECSKVVLSVETLITDGQYRLSSEDNAVKVFIASNFVGESILLVDSKIEYKMSFPEVPEDRLPTRMTFTYTLDLKRNLINVVNIYNAKGGVIFTQTTKDSRI